MVSLSRRDYRAALDFLEAIGEACDLDDFAARLVGNFNAVIPCAGMSYNEYNLRRRRIRWISDVETTADDIAAFEAHLSTHPMVNHFARHPDGGAVRMSDLLSQRQFRDLGIYRDVYRRHRLERVLGDVIGRGSLTIATALFRDGDDFSDRDRAMLTLLRPHLARAYRNAEIVTDLRRRLSLFEQGLEAGSLAVIELKPDGRVQSMTDLARTWLTRYLGTAGYRNRLPDAIEAWLRRAHPGPCLFERDGDRLTVQLIRWDARRLILLRERRLAALQDALPTLGLTRRETEILTWLSRGKTDGEIATILDISPRTVSHTLERVYRKLGVETRVAAIAKIADIVRP